MPKSALALLVAALAFAPVTTFATLTTIDGHVPVSYCLEFATPLGLGSTDAATGGAVSKLQQILAQDSSIYPEGLVTGYFGSATLAALQRFQAAQDIVASGTPGTTGYGAFGPLTRARLYSWCQGLPGTPTPSPSPTPIVPIAGAPSCTLSAKPVSVSAGRQSTVLSWTTTNATSGSIDQGVGAIPLISKGTRTVYLSTTTTYTMTITGPGGSTTCQTTVTVAGTPTPPPPLPPIPPPATTTPPTPPIATSTPVAPAYSVPFGYFQLQPAEYGMFSANATELGLVLSPKRNTPADLLTTLDTARAAHMHLYIELGNAKVNDTNSDGSLSVSGWEQGLAAWCSPDSSGTLHCPDLSSYVNDGTLLGLHIGEYSVVTPTAAQIADGYPTLADLKQMAAYAHTLWPTVPVAVDSSSPCVLDAQTWSSTDLNRVIMAFFTARMGNYTRGQTIMTQDIACANKAGLSYTWDINPFGATQTTIPTGDLVYYQHYLESVLLNPGAAKAVMVWRYWPPTGATVTNGVQTFQNFWNESVNPGITNALTEINTCAANPTVANCPSASMTLSLGPVAEVASAWSAYVSAVDALGAWLGNLF